MRQSNRPPEKLPCFRCPRSVDPRTVNWQLTSLCSHCFWRDTALVDLLLASTPYIELPPPPGSAAEVRQDLAFAIGDLGWFWRRVFKRRLRKIDELTAEMRAKAIGRYFRS